jgi:predicted small secreted protein
MQDWPKKHRAHDVQMMESRMMKRRRRRRILIGRVLLAIAMLGLTTIAVAGCHTVQGIGQDITAIGEGGQQMIDNGF